MPSKLVLFLQRNRVFSGFILALIYLIFSSPTQIPLAVGLGVATLGLIIRAWACGHLRKTNELDASGPYAYTRNPLYLGTFIIALGFGVASGSWWLFLLVGLYIGSIYFPVMNVEAIVLSRRLGKEYEEYAENVPLLFPRFSPWKKSDRGFDFQLYLKNDEYNAAIGFLIATAALVAKMYTPSFL